MSTDDKKDGESEKRKHKKIENLGEPLKFSLAPTDGLHVNGAGNPSGVFLNKDNSLVLGSANNLNGAVAFQSPAYSSGLLGIEAAHKNFYELVQSPTVTDSIADITSLGATATAGYQDMINTPAVTGAISQIGAYGSMVKDHMDAITVTMPQVSSLSFPTLQNSSVFNAMGLSAAGGLLTYEGKSLQELEKLEKEEQQKIVNDLNKKIDKQEKLLDEQVKDNQRKGDELSQVKTELGQLKDYVKQLEPKLKKVTSVDKGEKQGDIWFNKIGVVRISNKIIGELEPGSRDFHFFAILFECYPLTVDYETLTYRTLERLGKTAQSKTPQNYCQTAKSDIKKHASRIAELIGDYATEDGKKGYRLISPERQKRTRN